METSKSLIQLVKTFSRRIVPIARKDSQQVAGFVLSHLRFFFLFLFEKHEKKKRRHVNTRISVSRSVARSLRSLPPDHLFCVVFEVSRRARKPARNSQEKSPGNECGDGGKCPLRTWFITVSRRSYRQQQQQQHPNSCTTRRGDTDLSKCLRSSRMTWRLLRLGARGAAAARPAPAHAACRLLIWWFTVKQRWQHGFGGPD